MGDTQKKCSPQILHPETNPTQKSREKITAREEISTAHSSAEHQFYKLQSISVKLIFRLLSSLLFGVDGKQQQQHMRYATTSFLRRIFWMNF